MRISAKDKKRLMNIINSLMVAEYMKHQKHTTPNIWFDSEAEAGIKLYEEFGIELPALNQYQERMRLNNEN